MQGVILVFLILIKIFSTHALADSYRESYQSYEIVDYETTNWPSNRRCGYIHISRYSLGSWHYYTAGTNGGHIESTSTSERRCNCPSKYGPYDLDYRDCSKCYAAICYYDTDEYTPLYSWASSKTCPKGWGKGYRHASNGSNYTLSSQGYVINAVQGDPIYGYVTRYRTKYYDYISGRPSKT